MGWTLPLASACRLRASSQQRGNSRFLFFFFNLDFNLCPKCYKNDSFCIDITFQLDGSGLMGRGHFIILEANETVEGTRQVFDKSLLIDLLASFQFHL